MPRGAGDNGLNCNVDLVSHQGTPGGFKVFRYTDVQGHECAFYDTALLYPANALKLDGTSQGVAVLDMSDPSHPVQTDTLTELPMLSPHESLNLNPKRGLLAAVLGNPRPTPVWCRSTTRTATAATPSCSRRRRWPAWGTRAASPRTATRSMPTGTAVQAISAIDVTNPKEPHSIWQGNIVAHGMSLGGTGDRAYVADPGGDMLILDTSEIQARKPNPQAREVSRLTWNSASIPQNAKTRSRSR